MNRNILPTLIALLLVPPALLRAAELVHSSMTLPPLDAYGGATTIKAQATGYFWLKEIHGRWFFITPEGHGFIPLGVNHLLSYFGGEQGRLRTNELNLVKAQDGDNPQRAVERVEAMLREVESLNAALDAKITGLTSRGALQRRLDDGYLKLEGIRDTAIARITPAQPAESDGVLRTALHDPDSRFDPEASPRTINR